MSRTSFITGDHGCFFEAWPTKSRLRAKLPALQAISWSFIAQSVIGIEPQSAARGDIRSQQRDQGK